MTATSQDLIDMFLIHLREIPRTDDTIDTYRWQLMTADKGLKYGLDSSSEEELRAWIWRGKYALSSRKTCYSALASFYDWAVDRDYLNFNPSEKIMPPKVPVGLPRVAPDDLVRRILVESPAPYRLWGHLAAYGGLRCIEIWRLSREDVTETRIKVFGKGAKYRLVPTHPEVWALMEGMPAGRICHEIDADAVSGKFARHCTRRNFDLSLHWLRGWFATMAYRQSKDVRAVQELLGHSSLATTARYIGLDEAERQAIVNALPVFGAVGA